MSAGILYIVSTPIGNIKDITLRALEILREKANIILCEDTRQTLKLLSSHGINAQGRLVSFFGANEKSKTPHIIKMLVSEGKNVALVSSRGTPAISDPGFFLIKNAIASGVKIEPVPGVSSVICAISASGLPSDDFAFIGFLKRKRSKLKNQLLNVISSGIKTVVFFESPLRILQTLETLLEVFPNPHQISVVIGREMTKLYEEFIRGDLSEAIETVKKRSSEGKLKGEMTVVLHIPSSDTEILEENE